MNVCGMDASTNKLASAVITTILLYLLGGRHEHFIGRCEYKCSRLVSPKAQENPF